MVKAILEKLDLRQSGLLGSLLSQIPSVPLGVPLCQNLPIWKVKVRLTSHKRMLRGLVHIYGTLKLLDDERYLYLEYCSYIPATCNKL